MQGNLDPVQISNASALLGISVDAVRKDYFVTQAIHALTKINDDYFELIFQGGTSLSKGYQVIQRTNNSQQNTAIRAKKSSNRNVNILRLMGIC